MIVFRDLADFSMGMNVPPPPPVMSREEFEARKADLRRKRENERRGERYSWNVYWMAITLKFDLRLISSFYTTVK